MVERGPVVLETEVKPLGQVVVETELEEVGILQVGEWQ